MEYYQVIMACNGVLTPRKLDPSPSTKIFQPLLVLKFLPPPSPGPRAFYLTYLNWRQKHENANLLQKLIIKNNSQGIMVTIPNY